MPLCRSWTDLHPERFTCDVVLNGAILKQMQDQHRRPAPVTQPHVSDRTLALLERLTDTPQTVAALSLQSGERFTRTRDRLISLASRGLALAEKLPNPRAGEGSQPHQCWHYRRRRDS